MSRIQSIDVIRLAAIVAVIAIHTTPFAGVQDNRWYLYLGVVINLLARFAVPFFFVISGYFFAKKLKNSDSVWPPTLDILKRVGLIWLFFSLLYLLPYDVVAAFNDGSSGLADQFYQNVMNVVKDPVAFLFQGSKDHLWFLVSLGFAIVIVALLVRFCKYYPLIVIGVFSLGLYIFGLLAKAYSETSLGINIDFNTRNGPFFSTVFFFMGYAFSYLRITTSYFYYGLLILLAGYLLQFTEMFYLYSVYDVWPARQDFVVGTILLGAGISLMALSNHPWLHSKQLATIGQYTLGIYGMHYVFVDLLGHLDETLSTPVWELGYVFLVLLLSVGATLALSRVKPLRRVFV